MFTPPATSPLADATDWLVALVGGSLALGACVLAVALIGLLMLGGRLPVRRGMQVVLGCFVVLGAPTIAAGFTGIWQESGGSPPPPANVTNATPRDLPPATYNPYAGASVRGD